jgi:hypothetical protein
MGPMSERFARAGARSKPEFFRTVNSTSHSMYATPINVLDWPKAKVSKQSRKDVRSTRPLEVSSLFSLILVPITSLYFFLIPRCPALSPEGGGRRHDRVIRRSSLFFFSFCPSFPPLFTFATFLFIVRYKRNDLS